MNATIKKQWVEALRSGKYTQGEGSLAKRDDDFNCKLKHCCLGVLCEVIGISREPVEGSNTYVYDGSDEVLPEKVRESLDITEMEQKDLIDLNDGRTNNCGVFEQFNFDEIADWIEENL